MAEIFEHWHDYYLVQGGAAGTLVALLFVAVSVGIDYLTTERLAGARVFMNPVVIHFTAVFAAASLTLAPLRSLLVFVLIVGAGAAAAIVYSIYATLRVIKQTDDVTDRLCYGAIPAVGYAGADRCLVADLERQRGRTRSLRRRALGAAHRQHPQCLGPDHRSRAPA